MKTKLATLAVMAIITTSAFAQSMDVATVTCADLGTMDPDSITTLLFWIDGYMGGAAEDSTFDLDRLMGNIDGALALCAENPTSTVMEVLQQAENG